MRSIFLRLNDSGTILREADKVKVQVLTRLQCPNNPGDAQADEQYQEEQAKMWERLESAVMKAGEAYSKKESKC